MSDTSEIEPAIAVPSPTASWQEQDGLLREMWLRHQTPSAIAEALGRSVAAIMTRAARLGLPRRSAPGRKPGRRPVEDGMDSSITRSLSSNAGAVIGREVDVPPHMAERVCLMCLTKFQSIGRHNRICSNCKGSAEYESGARLPDLHFPVE